MNRKHKSTREYTLTLLFITLANILTLAQEGQSGIPISFPLATSSMGTPIYIGENDFPGVKRAAQDLQSDIERVTDSKPLLSTTAPSGKDIIIIGTIGKSELIHQLLQNKKLNVDEIAGKWENFLIETIEKPFPNVDRALVITGSDKRGTIFGIYEISKRIGVSPWYWWADVPVTKQKELTFLLDLTKGSRVTKSLAKDFLRGTRQSNRWDICGAI